MQLRSGLLTPVLVPARTSPSVWPSDKMVHNNSIHVKTIDEFTSHFQERIYHWDHHFTVMVIAQSLMNIPHDSPMRNEVYSLHKAVLLKFYTYEGPEYPFEFVSRLEKDFSHDKYASKIQKAFRKSQGYAAWAWHPDRLKAQGFFDV